MIHLTKEEQDILDGKKGKLCQTALENIVRYAQVLALLQNIGKSRKSFRCYEHFILHLPML